MATHSLHVVVISAEGLPPPNFGSLKPYVTASVGRGTFKTEAESGTEPRFTKGNTLQLQCTLADSFTVSVYDKNLLSDDTCLGHVRTAVAPFSDGGVHQLTEPLQAGMKKNGFVTFSVQLRNVDGSPLAAGLKPYPTPYDPYARMGPADAAAGAVPPYGGPPRGPVGVPPRGPPGAPPGYGPPRAGMFPPMASAASGYGGPPPPAGAAHHAPPPPTVAPAYYGPPPTGVMYHPPPSHAAPLDPSALAASVAAAETREAEVRSMFTRYDTNRDGAISQGELAGMLHDLGFGDAIVREEVDALARGGHFYSGRNIPFEQFAAYYNSLQERRWALLQRQAAFAPGAGMVPTPSGYAHVAATVAPGSSGTIVAMRMTGSGAAGSGSGEGGGDGKLGKSAKGKGKVTRGKGGFKLKFKDAKKAAKAAQKAAGKAFKKK